MFYFISHRGNLNGPDRDNENKQSYIEFALNKGFDVEIDIRTHKDKLWLGHDEPQELLNFEKIDISKTWFHAKDCSSLYKLSKYGNLNFFWHQNDDYTITSRGIFWNFPGKELTLNSINVLPSINNLSQADFNCLGICSDYIIMVKEKYKID